VYQEAACAVPATKKVANASATIELRLMFLISFLLLLLTPKIWLFFFFH
jgi:hypothetical protein